jgi:DNA repair exonuclease SbcCD nuclease subunit
MSKKVIAILLADIHLTLNAPIWRSAEEDWFEAMKRPLDEIKSLQEKYDCPILFAGDLFTRWNSTPELINFALKYLPEQMWGIPGQHDLPLHNYDDIDKSAFQTVMFASRLHYMHPNTPIIVEKDLKKHKMLVFSFPYGFKIKPIKARTDDHIYIALAHEYVWIKGHNYTGAPEENRLGRNAAEYRDGRWKGYDLVVYGDNHKGFMVKPPSSTTFFNCGSMMRTNSDQIEYKPAVGLLHSNGRVARYYLDTSEDKFLDISKKALGEDTLDMRALLKELEKLDSADLDFTELVQEYLKRNKINIKICDIIRKAMGV